MGNTQIARGVTLVRAAVIAFLEANVPAALIKARTDWGLADFMLPSIDNYRAYEPTGLDSRKPLLGVSIRQASNYGTVGIDDTGALERRVRYTCNVYVWNGSPYDTNDVLVSPPREMCLQVRDDLSAVISHVLTNDWAEDTSWGEFVGGSMTVDYSEATKVQGDRWIAATKYTFDFYADEASITEVWGQMVLFNIIASNSDQEVSA